MREFADWVIESLKSLDAKTPFISNRSKECRKQRSTAEMMDAIHHVISEEGRQFDQHPLLVIGKISQGFVPADGFPLAKAFSDRMLIRP